MDEKDLTSGSTAQAPEGTGAGTAASEPAAPAPGASPSAVPAPESQAAPAPGTAPSPASTAPYPGATEAPAPAPYPAPSAPSPTPALVCGILAIVLSGIPIAGIVLGIVAIVLAGRYYSAGGTEGTAKGGRICGIIGIVFSVIMIIVGTVITVIGINEMMDADMATERITSISTTETGRSSASAAVDAEDQPIYDAADPYLQQIADLDPAMVASVAQVMQTSFDEAMASGDWDITLASCGVDPQEMARAMMKGFTYQPYVATTDGNTAKATYKVTVRSIFDVGDDLFDEMTDILSDVNAGFITEDEAAPRIGQALMEAIQDEDPEDDNIWDVDLTQNGGAWSVDQDSWDEELDYFFAFI